MAQELINLRADAMATNCYYVVETMGRRAGWLAYGVAVAGEAHLVVAVEDVVDDLAIDESVKDPDTGAVRTEKRLSLDRLVDRVVDLVVAREKRGKHYGTVVLAEGLAELLPESFLREVGRDDHGHLSLGRLEIGRRVASMAAERYEKRTGKTKKLVGRAARLRGAVRAAARVRRPAGQPARARRVLRARRQRASTGTWSASPGSSSCATCRSPTSSTR